MIDLPAHHLYVLNSLGDWLQQLHIKESFQKPLPCILFMHRSIQSENRTCPCTREDRTFEKKIKNTDTEFNNNQERKKLTIKFWMNERMNDV